MPVHPERVISRAMKAGLSATVELQRNISNKVTKKYYKSSHNTWRIRQQIYQKTIELGNPDFSHIGKAESSIRDNTRKMLFENGAKYGFSEVSRQKNSDDTVDPINQRINANGVVVRENSEIMFPMPNPVSFGTYTRRDGKARKRFRRAGYEGSSFGPRVTLAHPDLPSLDFGDAVRSHNEYLATFCAIHDVPARETTRYSHLFLLLVRPYLEYLYSEFKVGKANFQKGVNLALRQVKELILKSGYRPTRHVKRTVTKKLEFEGSDDEDENKTFFKKHGEEARAFYGNHPAVAELERLMGREYDDQLSKDNDDALFTKKDVEYIRNKAAKRTRVSGSIMHRRIADLFPSPWHLNDVIFGGDRYTLSSDYLLISEMPLQTKHGTGKVDLILCERTITEDGKRAFWKPVFVLEIKTRLGQSWYIAAEYKESEVRPDGSPLQRVVCNFPLNDYPLSDEIWDAIVRSTPTPSARTQLDIYCQALTESFENATQHDLGHILKGVIVVDSSVDIDSVRRVIEPLIVHAYESAKNRTRRLKRTVFTPRKSDNSRIALVVDEQPGPNRKEETVTEVPWGPVYTPFTQHKKTKSEFILYLAGHSPTSAGQSASWNARNYHGLQMLHQMNNTRNDAEFVWIDLTSQFNEPRLAEARLRLRPRGYSEDEVIRAQSDCIRGFFESIKVKGYLDDILSFLYNEGELPSFDLKAKKNKGKVIIITGADTFRDATPTSHKERLNILMDNLLSSLPDDEVTTIVWFDSPVPSVEKSIPYSSRSLLPFYETSSLAEVVTEIIWNLPVAPRGAIEPGKWKLPIVGDSPMHDDIRVIIHHTTEAFQMELTHVPLLRGWSKRFRNKGSGLVIRERELDDIVPDRTLRNRMKLLALTMLPWLVKLWSGETLLEESAETLEQQFVQLEKEFRGGVERLTFRKEVLDRPLSKSPSVLNLLRFRLPVTLDAQSFQMMTAGKINSQRLYRTPSQLKTKPIQESPTPRIPKLELEVEEELEQDWIFGIKFEEEGDVTRPWWMVLQDPTNEARMLVGCFTHRPAAKDGFLWAETSQEILTEFSFEDILGLSQTILTGSKTDVGMEAWISMSGSDQAFDSGLIEVIGGGRSTVGHLRAFRQTLSGVSRTRTTSRTQPTESFYNRVVDSLRRYLESVARPTPVTVNLEMKDDECKVTFTDTEEGEVLQTVTQEHTVDLISLLRWPMVKGRPMYTDSGEYVTWSVFDDIQFEDLDFIRPYVSFKAARSTPEELPKRIVQFFEEAKTLHVSIEHDHSVCPMVTDKAVDHGECWRITLPPRCSEPVRRQLGRVMTGEDVNGLLAPGRLYSGKLYIFQITRPTVSQMDDSIVFHEDRYIRMLLRGMGLSLKPLEPGTFLSVSDQKWYVDISWDGRSYLRWSAQSLLSGLYLDGFAHIIELSHGHGAEEECERLMESITSDIPEEEIANYSELEERVLSGLKDLGYSGSSPPCHLRVIEPSSTVFSYGVYPLEGFLREPLMRFSIEAEGGSSPDALIEMVEMSLSEGDLNHFNIRNSRSFMRRLETWVRRNVPIMEDMHEEPEEWELE